MFLISLPGYLPSLSALLLLHSYHSQPGLHLSPTGPLEWSSNASSWSYAYTSILHRAARVRPLHDNQIMSLAPSKPSQWLPIALNIKIKLLSTAYKALSHLALACISLASSWSTIPLNTALPLHCHLFLEHAKFQDFSLEVPLDWPSMACI